MSRKTARELTLHMIFEMDFTQESSEVIIKKKLDSENFAALSKEDELYEEQPDERDIEYIRRSLDGVCRHLTELDTYIERYSVGWKFGRISRIVTCIMRLSMYEILYMPDIPKSASINEAVELAKRYDTQEAAAFINGILGTFVKKEAID